MRALRVVGVTGDGSVVLEDPGRRERYTVPADEQLRAAARGDVTRLGQIAIELESQLRPREIQARIRGGASVDQVAAAAGVPVQKIERFAYPVLLERSRTAELAQGAHPQRTDGPDLRTLGETVAHTFGLRGQDHTTATWDSWKGDDGKWVVALSWRAGRSDNAAHWAFQPGAHGGTVVALDEHASDLVEGLPARPLRTVGAVVDLGRDEEPEPEQPHEPESPQVRAAVAGETRTDPRRGIAPEQRRSSPPSRSTGSRPATGRPSASDFAEEYAIRQDTDRQDTPTRQTPPQAAPSPAVASPAASSDVVDEQTASRPAEPMQESAATSPGIDRGADAASDTSTAEPRATGQSAAERPAVWDRAGRTSPPHPDRAGETPAARPTGSAPAASREAPATVERTGPAAASGSPDAEAADTPRPTGTSAAGSPDRDATESGSGAAGSTEPEAPASTGPASTGPVASDPAAPDATGADETAQGRSTGSGNRSTGNRRTKKGKPVMPSWDEVLLGVRGQR